MQGRLFLCLAVLALIVWTGTGIAQQSKVAPEVWEKVRAEGVVRVIVTLSVPTKLEGKVTPEALRAHQQAVAAAQDAVLVELVGTNHRVTGRYKNIPGLGLEVGADALTVLEHSARVVQVTEDTILRPYLSQSVPLVEGDQAWAAGFDGTIFTRRALCRDGCFSVLLYWP